MKYRFWGLILCVVFSLSPSFWENFFSKKESQGSTQEQRKSSAQQRSIVTVENRFSSLDYKSVLRALSLSLHSESEVLQLKQLLLVLLYLETGVQQVFMPQDRIQEAEAIKTQVCAVRKRLATEWFLYKEGAFLRLLEDCSKLKSYGVKILFMLPFPFAQKGITNTLHTKITTAFISLDERFAQEQQENDKMLQEIAQEKNEQIKTKESQIEEKESEISRIEADTLAWKADKTEFERQKAATEQLSAEHEQFEKENSAALQAIEKEIALNEQYLEEYEQFISHIEEEEKEARGLYEAMEAYNKNKSSNSEGFFSSIRKLIPLQEDASERERILSLLNKYRELIGITGITIFEGELFSEAIRKKVNKASFDRHYAQERESYTALLRNVEQTREELMRKKDTLNAAQVAYQQKMNLALQNIVGTGDVQRKQFKHPELARGSNESEAIAAAIAANDAKIKSLKSEIGVLKEELAQLRQVAASSYQAVQEERDKKKKEAQATLFEQIVATIDTDGVNFLGVFFPSVRSKGQAEYYERISELLWSFKKLRLSYRCFPSLSEVASHASGNGTYSEELTLAEKLVQQKEHVQERFTALLSTLGKYKDEFLKSKDVPSVPAVQNIQEQYASCSKDETVSTVVSLKIDAAIEDILAFGSSIVTLLEQEKDPKKGYFLSQVWTLYVQEASPLLALLSKSTENKALYKMALERQKARCNLVTSAYDTTSLFIKDEQTVQLAPLFFEKVAQHLEKEIINIVLQLPAEGIDIKKWFLEQYKKIYKNEYALFMIEQLQLSWYENGAHLKALFEKVQNECLNKKRALIVQLGTYIKKSLMNTERIDLYVANGTIKGRVSKEGECIYLLEQLAGCIELVLPLEFDESTQLVMNEIKEYIEKKCDGKSNELYMQTIRPSYTRLKKRYETYTSARTDK